MDNLIVGLIIGILASVAVFMGVRKRPNFLEKKAADSAPATLEDSIPGTVETDDTQLIAVITAALMAYQENGKQLVVRSVRRVGTRSAWAEAGRRQQLG